MIQRSKHFDLGQDRTRIKDPRDAMRQSATVDALLERFFHRRADHRWEIQILADEVGMGKTFVGLGVAYSILEAMKKGAAVDDLRGCYQKIVIITPNNHALFSKWRREVGEFVKRCVLPQYREHAGRWFAPVSVDRLDELAYELRRPGAVPRIIVVNMRIFAGGQLRHYDLKRRHLLGILFRHWSVRFNNEQRDRLLKGAPGGWPSHPKRLHDFTIAECERLHFSGEELLRAVRKLDASQNGVEKLLETCKEIAAPYVQNRAGLFTQVERQLVQVYRALMGHLINNDLPLVIVDEAHHWRHGANGYVDFIELIGCRTRRSLLLTATPFQLRPSEMLDILQVGDQLHTCSTEAASEARRERLHTHRETVVRPTLERAAEASVRFAKVWSKLPATATRELIQSAWESPPATAARAQLEQAARRRSVVTADEIDRIIDGGLCDIVPEIRTLLREGLRLFVYNARLSNRLGDLVIRHRRRTEHRLFRIGMEYHPEATQVHQRPDRHVLHAAPGMDVRGDGELPHYLLMRCVSEMKRGKGRSSLGSALTGCYSTLSDSSEGRKVKSRLAESANGKVYLALLMGLVNQRQDPKHPKIRQVVETALQSWKAGEKTLIFCFRTNTAKRLHEILDQRIRKELNRRRERCMGGPESLKALKARLTGRDRDLVVLGLDRVLWSLIWAKELTDAAERELVPDDLEIMDDELGELAALGLRYGIDFLGERIDRVFLNRACEHIVAQRLLRNLRPSGLLKRMLTSIAEEGWVHGPYALFPLDDGDESGAEVSHFDERGVHSTYEQRREPSAGEIQRTATELQERRSRARKHGQTSVLDVYGRGPSLWLGANPRSAWEQAAQQPNYDVARTLADMHGHLLSLTLADSEVDWESRRLVMQGLRRAVLRESVLLRLLPEKKDRAEAEWGDLLAHSFFNSLPSQHESMADRVAVFLEDLMAASGCITDPDSARFALYDATKLRDQQFVALVSSQKDQRTRERVYSGFNTPLLPEILVCTSVGQEGIDLHRHCRHVVHFDLAWNPAVLDPKPAFPDGRFVVSA